MSEELIDNLVRTTTTRRLRFLQSDVASVAGGNSQTSPAFATLVVKYPGQGIFVPDNLQVFGFDNGYQNYNPGPKNYNYTVRVGYNGRIIFDGRESYNADVNAPNSNFLNFYENFDNGVSLYYGQWYYVDVYSYCATALMFQAICVGTEFLP